MGSPSEIAEQDEDKDEEGAEEQGEAADTTGKKEEGSDEATEESTDDSFDPSLGLINSGPINVDKPIEEPVTSGSDGVTGDPGGSN